MSVELIFCIVIAAAATLLPRILKTERRHRREVSKILLVTGTVCSGILAGLLGLEGRFGILASLTVFLTFVSAAVIIYLLGRPKRPKVEKSRPDSFSQIPRERHDYTDDGKP